jgi:hypothetical protein
MPLYDLPFRQIEHRSLACAAVHLHHAVFTAAVHAAAAQVDAAQCLLACLHGLLLLLLLLAARWLPLTTHSDLAALGILMPVQAVHLHFLVRLL